MALDLNNPDALIYQTFLFTLRVVKQAGNIGGDELGQRIGELLNEVGNGDTTLVPGAADAAASVQDDDSIERRLADAMFPYVAQQMREQDREIALRLRGHIDRLKRSMGMG